jgi:hypothetical protein
MAPATATTPRVSHEEFCLPRPELSEVRMESYPAVGLDNRGQERTLIVTRCIECGAATYRPKD